MTLAEGEIRTGRCLCGAVRFETEGPPLLVARCHCLDCQRLTGTGHSTGAMFAESRLRLRGAVREFQLTSEAGRVVTRVFCPACGSPILGKNEGMPGYVTLSLGALDDSSGFEPSVEIFTRSKRPWDAPSEALASFEAQPDWKPGAG